MLHSFFSYKLYTLLILFITYVSNLQYPPTWLTSNYIRSGNQNLFTTLTPSGVVNTFQFIFSSTLPGIPYLGYGIKAYQGNDYFGEERFQIRRIDLTAASFTVAVQTIGATNLHLLNVPYIAIDPQFPYHINSFDNVPVNYSAGPLVNVSVQSLETQYYFNVINYTQQAAATPHRYFNQPLSSNKILLFMTCMFITGNNQPQGTPASSYNALNLSVYTEAVSNQTYMINVTLRVRINLERLQYSMVIFNQIDVQSSLSYYLYFQKIYFTDQGGFLPVPIEFVDNFIMGFTDFSSYKTKTAIHFQWEFMTLNGVHGVFMPISVGKSPFRTVISRVGYTVFYMKTWTCPSNTFLDLTDNLCKNCPIQGCQLCLSYKICSVCDASNHYKALGNVCTRCDVDNNFFLNPDTNQCEFCPEYLCPRPKVQKGQCNSLIITIHSTPQLPIQYDPSAITIQNEMIALNYSEQSSDGKWIKIYANYQRDIPSSQLLILYLGPNDRRVIQCDTSVPLMVYSPIECNSEQNIINMMKGIIIASYVLLFFSLITGKIVGLELFGVLQLAYFSLGSYSYLNIYNAPFSLLKVTNGFNLEELLPDIHASKILEYLQLSNNFLNNFNLMLILPISLILIFLVLYLIAYLTLNKIFQQKILKIFKQGSITLAMFNIYNFCYSFGLQLRFGMDGLSDLQKGITILVICVSIIVFACFVLLVELSDPSQYGEFKDKFKPSFICKFYIPLSVIYRAAIVFYLSTNTQYQQSTLLVLALTLSFMMYFIVNLPFNRYYQNYRAGLCHFTHMVTLLAANYYRSMKSNTPIQIKARLYNFSLLVIVLIGLCLLLSSVILVVEIVKFVKQICSKRKKQVMDQNRKQTEASIVQINAHASSIESNQF